MRESAKWAIFSHWERAQWLWRMDVVQNPTQLFAALLAANHDSLVIIKAFEVVGARESQLIERFADCRRLDNWYAPRPPLRNFLEEEASCETLEAKALFHDGSERLRWRPLRKDKAVAMEEARMEGKLPGFVKNAQTFVVWAIDDVVSSGAACSSRMIVGHPANCGIFKGKTIYNALSKLIEEGKVIKTRKRELGLSEKGQEAVEAMRTVWEIKERKRVKTLRID